MNGPNGKSGQRRAMSGNLNSFMMNGRRWITVFALFSLFLNILVPVTQASQSTSDKGEFVEICTQGGTKQISLLKLSSLDAESKDMENCPICADCPLCWQTQSTTMLLAQDIWHTRDRRYISARFFIDNDFIQINSRNSWPDNRGPPRI